MTNEEIWLLRNSHRKETRIYLSEAIRGYLKNTSKYLKKECGNKISMSDAAFIILCRFFRDCGKDVSFLNEHYRLKLKALDRDGL